MTIPKEDNFHAFRSSHRHSMGGCRRPSSFVIVECVCVLGVAVACVRCTNCIGSNGLWPH